MSGFLVSGARLDSKIGILLELSFSGISVARVHQAILNILEDFDIEFCKLILS